MDKRLVDMKGPMTVVEMVPWTVECLVGQKAVLKVYRSADLLAAKMVELSVAGSAYLSAALSVLQLAVDWVDSMAFLLVALMVE